MYSKCAETCRKRWCVLFFGVWRLFSPIYIQHSKGLKHKTNKCKHTVHSCSSFISKAGMSIMLELSKVIAAKSHSMALPHPVVGETLPTPTPSPPPRHSPHPTPMLPRVLRPVLSCPAAFGTFCLVISLSAYLSYLPH